MLQRKLTLVPGVFAVALAGIPCVISAAAARAPENCLAAPNAPAPRDEHWYYRTDRTTNRQCWYLAPRDTTVRKHATQEPKLPGSQLPLPPQAPPSTPPSAPSPDETTPAGAAISDAGETETKIPAPEPAIDRPEPARSPDMPPSFERETPRSNATVSFVPAPADGAAGQSHARTGVKTTANAGQPSPAIVITLVLLALFGPIYHTVQWLRRRKARDRRNTERSRWPAPDNRTDAGLEADSRELIAERLQQLLQEMQTKLYETPDAVGTVRELEPEQDRRPAENPAPTMKLAASNH